MDTQNRIGSVLTEKGGMVMDERDKVIKGFEYCDLGASGTCYEKECPYYQSHDCTDELKNDILDLLKEQEPVRVGKKIKAGYVVLDFYQCGYCKNAIRKPWRYCPFCGQAVKWNEQQR